MAKKIKYYDPTKRCLCCKRLGVDLHHIKSRKAGGSDHHANLMPLCREHHTEAHSGLYDLSKKYPMVKSFLIVSGWTLCPIKKEKWVNYSSYISKDSPKLSRSPQ